MLTVCNCCPCCCLWRILPEINTRIAAKINCMPGVVVAVGDECVGCGTCAQTVCFVDAIRLDGRRAVIGTDCRGCGRCVEVCPQKAVRITIDRQDRIAAAIDNIDRLVDLT